MDSPYTICVDICRYGKNRFRDVSTNIFYHGDVMTIFWGRFDQFRDVLSMGRFDLGMF